MSPDWITICVALESYADLPYFKCLINIGSDSVEAELEQYLNGSIHLNQTLQGIFPLGLHTGRSYSGTANLLEFASGQHAGRSTNLLLCLILLSLDWMVLKLRC